MSAVGGGGGTTSTIGAGVISSGLTVTAGETLIISGTVDSLIVAGGTVEDFGIATDLVVSSGGQLVNFGRITSTTVFSGGSLDNLDREGAASESLLDDGSRGAFHNAAEFTALYHGAASPGGFFAPRVESGATLEVIRRRLARLAA